MDTLKKALAISILTLTLPLAVLADNQAKAGLAKPETNQQTPSSNLQSAAVNQRPPSSNQQTVVAKEPKDEVMDAIAAVVNDDVITLDDVNDNTEGMKQKLLMSGQDIPDDNVIRKKVLDLMVNKKLQTQIAKRNHIEIEVEEINTAIQHIADSNHISLTQMRSELEKQGMTYKEFRKQLKEQLMLQKIQQRSLAGKVTVTDQEVDDLINKMASEQQDGAPMKYHLANIMIALPESPNSNQTHAAQLRADAIMKQLHEGVAFKKVAASESDAHHALEGGDMGWRKFAELPSLFATEVKSMKPGDIRGPLRAPNGIHIIQLIETKIDGKMPNHDQVKNMIFQRKMAEKAAQWVQELRDQSFVKTYL